MRWAESPRRKKSHGEVTIMNGSAKEIAKQEYDGIAYKVTPQGGIALPLDNREHAQMVEQCYRTRDTTINPIIDWTDAEVWEFIHEYKVPYCELYDQGYKRLGCIGCPMAGGEMQKREFERYPKYYKAYLLAFDKMLKARQGNMLTTKWTDAESVMKWWLKKQGDTETEIMGVLDEQ